MNIYKMRHYMGELTMNGTGCQYAIVPYNADTQLDMNNEL